MSPEQKDVIVTRLTDNIPLIVKAFCVILISACTATTAWAVLRKDVSCNTDRLDGIEVFDMTLALRLRKLEDADLIRKTDYKHILKALDDIKETLDAMER